MSRSSPGCCCSPMSGALEGSLQKPQTGLHTEAGSLQNHREDTLLPPANEVCEGYVFTRVCPSTVGGEVPAAWGVCSQLCLLQGGICCWGDGGWGGVCSQGLIVTPNAAGGTHPTGMHSCFLYFLVKKDF